VATATTGEWGKYYATAEQKRQLAGGDPLKRHLKRYILRQRCLFAGSSVLLLALMTTFCVVLMR
jgi:hypothetical protein